MISSVIENISPTMCTIYGILTPISKREKQVEKPMNIFLSRSSFYFLIVLIIIYLMESKSNNIKLIIYVDMASQPSRSVLAFCRINQIPHEMKVLRVGKGE